PRGRSPCASFRSWASASWPSGWRRSRPPPVGATSSWRPALAGCTSSSVRSSRGGTVAETGAARKAAPETGRASMTRAASPVELNRVIHERVRLGIVSALAVNDTLSFNELKELLGTTDGNLSVHARRLEEAGYVECLKSFTGRVPRTEYR